MAGCCHPDDNVPHRLIYLNFLFTVFGTLQEKIRNYGFVNGTVLMGTGLEVSEAHAIPRYLTLCCLRIASQDISLQAMLQGHAYLSAAMLPTTMMVMDLLSQTAIAQ